MKYQGADMLVRSVEIVDNTTPASLFLDIFDIDTIQRAEEWRAWESVLWVGDAQLTRRARGRVALRLGAKSVLTHQPHVADAETLRLSVANLANSKSGAGSAAAWRAWGGERAAACSAAQVRTRLAEAAPFCAALHAMLTRLDLDNIPDDNEETVAVTFSDHTGELRARIPVNVLEESLGISSDQLKQMSEEERAEARWRLLLEQCAARLAHSPPRLLVVALRRAAPTDVIPLY